MSTSRTFSLVSTSGIKSVASFAQSTFAALCAILLAFLMVSCGPADPSASSSRATITPSTGEQIAGISAPPSPPGSADRPLAPGQNGTKYLPNGLPAFQPARGVNADMLFAEKINDPDERFRRLENAVMDIRREFDSVMPAIVRLSAVEQDMQELLKQLQVLTGSAPEMDIESAPIAPVTADSLPSRPFPEAPEDFAPEPGSPEPVQALPATPGLAPADNGVPEAYAQAQTPPPEPMERAPPPPERPPDKPPDKPVMAQPPPAATPPPAPAVSPVATPAKAGLPAVRAVRVGKQDNGVIRLVLDLSGPTAHSFDLDNEEGLLLIELPQAVWSAAPKGMFADTPLLTSWTSEPMKDGAGSRLIINLSTKVEVVSDSALTDPARIVLDLKRSP